MPSPGDPTDPNYSGFGGGVFCGYLQRCQDPRQHLLAELRPPRHGAGRRDRIRARSAVRQAHIVVQRHLVRPERCVRGHRLHARLRRRHPPQGPAVRQRSARQLLPEQSQRRAAIHEPVRRCRQRSGRRARHVPVHDADGPRARYRHRGSRLPLPVPRAVPVLRSRPRRRDPLRGLREVRDEVAQPGLLRGQRLVRRRRLHVRFQGQYLRPGLAGGLLAGAGYDAADAEPGRVGRRLRA